MSKRQADRLNKLRREKRGVVLLVVVSILTLFLMIGVTYVLVAGNYHTTSKGGLRAKAYGDESEREIEEVMTQILVGTPQFGGTGPRSVLTGHSLLMDLYGNDSIAGTIRNIQAPPNGQIVYFTANLPVPLQPIPNYFAGRVITFTDGPAAGLSSRVMAYFPGGANGGGVPELMVETPESDLPIPVGPSDGTRFIINGAPFNGTGAGFSLYTPGPDAQWGVAGNDDDGDGTVDNRTEAGFSGSDDVLSSNMDAFVTLNGNNYASAYLPNYPFYPAGAANPAAGGLDEPYDIPNWNDMYLAMVPPQKMSQYDNFPLLPSYHRPDLVRFWQQILTGSLLSGVAQADQRNAFLNPFGYDGILPSGDDWAGLTPVQARELANLKRMMVLRPLRQDHPNFTGGNQNFAEDNLNGPYDVDNDGDGITDSIWIDAGLPVVTAPNGRRYKRLVAIMIKDLDGRVNPTLHGNLELATVPNSRTAAQVTDQFAGINPNNPTPIYLPRGLGYGPAEVDFRHILNDDVGVYNNVLLQRYFTTASGASLPGFPNNDDGWSQIKTIGMPIDHTNPPLSAYFTPPDVWGRSAMAVDYTGQPAWLNVGTNERQDDPYEVQWDQWRASVDSPYTVGELEALLRYHDLGATVLPSRLMLPPPYGTGANAYLATESRGTPGPSQVRRESFGMGIHIPAPKMIVPRELRAMLPGGAGSSATILDLYYAAIISGRSWAPNIGSNPGDPNYAAFNAQLQLIVPFEILKGQMLNLNRELGNGIDDNGNGVVDEPAEYNSEQIPTTAGQLPFDYLNDNPVPTTFDNRQMMARHLYCLAMLLRNNSSPTVNYDTNGDNMPTPPETARLLAQWAINVVDFRDADSIMTPFEYDLNPFDNNGWSTNIDGNPNTPVPPGEGGVVWGVERPELLITETVNGHDRRTEDTADEDPDMKRTTDAVNRDTDYDQRLMPQGWSFIELYNPWFDRGNNVYDHKGSDLYTNGGVDVSRVNAGGSPVWRMIFVRSNDGISHYNTDPDSPQPEALTVPVGPPPAGVNVERSVYFADLSGGAVSIPGGTTGEVYFPSATVPRVPIAPGRYAVVGSSGNYDGATGTYTTYLGRLTTVTGFDPATLNLPMTRRIVLNPTAQTVRLQDNRNAGADDVNIADLQPVVAIPVDMVLRNGAPAPQSFNITEPVNGYLSNPPPPPSMWQPPGPNDEGHFAPPADLPFDVNRGGEFSRLGKDDTLVHFRTVHLQRLANPMLAWNAVSNPYITIDKSSMDVMSYNGVTDDTNDPQNMAPGPLNFQSFQRGGPYSLTDPEAVGGYTLPANGYVRSLWEQYPPNPIPTGPSPNEVGTGPHFLPFALYNTLGHLNRRYHPYFTAAVPNYRGAPYFQDATGNPAAPFPWLTFNNRPFNNPSELMHVPCWHSSKLLEKFIFQDPTAPPPGWTNMYDPPNKATGFVNVPYGHLLNFFWTASASTANDAMEMSRLFDFIETRTPYIGTEKYYNPVGFQSPNPAPAGFRPPFNYLSRFRDPGRININTTFSDNVWNAAVRGSPTMCTLNPPFEGDGGQFLARVALNRQGWGNNAGDLLTLAYDANYPSYFSNPFRTADSADMMPPNSNAAPQFQPRKSAADGGLLRRDPYLDPAYPTLAPPAPPPQPVYPALNGNQPLFASESVTPHQDASRNPYFRYQPMQKVGNVFSTNSNCFAVWVTVGYFEVEANTNNLNSPGLIDLAHPDGLRLAAEVGVDTGEVKRHRAFFIIDRSIPVGYEPGQRHNTDKAILLKRFIE